MGMAKEGKERSTAKWDDLSEEGEEAKKGVSVGKYPKDVILSDHD